MIHRWWSSYSVILLALTGASPATQSTADPNQTHIHWSNSDVDKTPSGIEFHGPYFNETVTVSANHLPAHDWVAISMDLLILRSWDGSVAVPATGRRSPDGPDYLRIDLAGGPTLMFNTFSNLPADDPGFNDDGKTQNFPSPVPGEHLRPQTGSAEHNTLGYNFPWAGPPELVPMDAVYHLRFVVPHHDGDAAVNFTAMGLSSVLDENWGVRNVEIRPLKSADVPVPDSATVAKAFADALDVKGNNQADACVILVLGGDATTDWISANVHPQPIDQKQAAKLLLDLAGDDTKIAERDAAEPALRELGSQAEVFVRDLRQTAPREIRTRCDGVLTAIGVTQIDDEDLRRVMLATRMLEIIGSPKALVLRHTLVSQP
jgi:hypothetical protein